MVMGKFEIDFETNYLALSVALMNKFWGPQDEKGINERDKRGCMQRDGGDKVGHGP